MQVFGFTFLVRTEYSKNLNFTRRLSGHFWVCCGIKDLCYIRVSKCEFGFLDKVFHNGFRTAL